MANPFSWDYLTTVPGENAIFGPFSIAYLILFSLGLIASIIFYNDWGRPLVPDPVLRRLLRRWSGWAMTIFGLGLFFFAIRILQINPFTFGMRLWLYLTFLAFLGYAGYIAWYLRTRYPLERAEWQERKRRQAYIRPAAGPLAAGRAGNGRPAVYPGRRALRRRRR